MRIAVIGTGYVGLVTGVSLSEIGHNVSCIDIDPEKVQKLNQGIPTIYEPGLKELMQKNMRARRLSFTSDHKEGLDQADIVYIAVGTPQRDDGSANLDYVEQAARDIAANMTHDLIVVIKSTVPIGTNRHIKNLINRYARQGFQVRVASNPEFLREGSAVRDTFHGDRIIIGAEDTETAAILNDVNTPFDIPILKTDLSSAEMIKYASNAFLATKISFVNEIANICEIMGANVDEVAKGMGFDHRIGPEFLKAGIGYGGSCFPKDTNALVQLAGNHHYEFHLLKSVIEVNNNQQVLLIGKMLARFGSLNGKRVAVLGLAFKPHTDDLRESPALAMIPKLHALGAEIVAYDPIAVSNAKRQIKEEIQFTEELTVALRDADCAVIITDWPDVKNMNLSMYHALMKSPIVFDGRNCYALADVKRQILEYYSIGRPNQTPELIG
ncbi:UDP-glucose/GDP-mannose dehydrogenase family protein [Sporolactobacillus sp. THM7-7]|nr:UDP-glucose/GDP-mannose dehydrogenase family protein [Sporolactobacillus sp. THM7-7]